MKFIAKLSIWVFSFLILSTKSYAQTNEVYPDAWLFINNHLNIGKHWTIGNEIHIRRTNFFKNWENFIVRPSVVYKLNKTVDFAVGYSYIRTYPYSNFTLPFTTEEHNIWEQVELHHELSIVKFSHRFRLEHRFREKFAEDSVHHYSKDGFNFSNRFRYRFGIKIPFAKRFHAVIFDEIWIAMSGKFQYPTFNKNWLGAGFGVKPFKNAVIELGYIHQVVRINSSNYEVHPTIVLALRYDFNIMDQEKIKNK